MPSFLIKNGLANQELKTWLADHEKETIRVSVEVETPKDRLRGGFHGLLNAWYKSGEFSQDVKTEAKLKRHYKFVGCEWVTSYFEYKGEEYEDGSAIRKDYPDYNPNEVVRQPRHWEDMTKTQQCRALDGMITDINLSETNNKNVLYKLSLLTNDIEMLNWLKWDKFQNDNKQINNIVNKFEGEII